ncbi:replication protein A [Halobellus salinus]|uniref:Replication protein A n=2 Tax=Halobellus salinus TaxID=931585 RepID=A0A830EA44_9EURY|nr:replication protein A [Halobellus salinus]SMP09093.1 replication factor A1 [Halobellus salinus]
MMDVDDHAEELASALGVDKAEVKDDLENLLSYSVPVDEAKQSIRRKHGGGGGNDAAPTTKDIDDVTTGDGNVTVTVRVLSVGRRSIRYQGDEQTIREGEFADETGRISYTAWEDFGFQPGDSITVGNAGVREWDGEPELNIGQSSTVAIETTPVEVPYEVGGDTGLVDLRAGDRGRNVEVEVIESEERVIDGRNGDTTIRSGVVADESGRLPFTDWAARPELREESEHRFEEVYVREFRGVPQVNLSEYTTVTPLGRSVDVDDDATRLPIGEAVGAGGLFDVEVVGNVLEVRDGSGLIERCPDCGRVLQNGQCRAHGDVDGEDDMRVKAIVDDGTGTVTAMLGRDLTELVYDGTMAEAMTAARDAMDKKVVADEIRERIVGREYRVRGNLSVDDYGANLEATEFERTGDDPAGLAADRLREVRQ